jgi:hypothetical protein
MIMRLNNSDVLIRVIIHIGIAMLITFLNLQIPIIDIDPIYNLSLSQLVYNQLLFS